MYEKKKLSCVKCDHPQPEHRDDICYGERFCTCIKFEMAQVIEIIKEAASDEMLRSRTSVSLPKFISTHDNWGGKGWEYQKKWGKSQSKMVEFLSQTCGLYQDEIGQFLRCKDSSVRGRLSELRNSDFRV